MEAFAKTTKLFLQTLPPLFFELRGGRSYNKKFVRLANTNAFSCGSNYKLSISRSATFQVFKKYIWPLDQFFALINGLTLNTKKIQPKTSNFGHKKLTLASNTMPFYGSTVHFRAMSHKYKNMRKGHFWYIW